MTHGFHGLHILQKTKNLPAEHLDLLMAAIKELIWEIKDGNGNGGWTRTNLKYQFSSMMSNVILATLIFLHAAAGLGLIVIIRKIFCSHAFNIKFISY